MAANKTVLDHLRLLECLKWNTDAAHPLTQKNLRKEASESEDTLDCLGDKKTFRKRLATLATFCNCDSDTSNWHIYYDGVEKDLKPDSTSKGTRANGIYYKHDLSPSELDFIIHQIESSSLIEDSRKEYLEKKLIRLLGNKFYSELYRKNNLKKKTLHFFTPDFPSSYFSIIDDAIRNNKMITFQMQILGANGNLVSPQNKHSQKTSNTSKDTKHAPEPGSDRLVVSPYNIVLYNGIYFLIGNRLLGYNAFKKIYIYSPDFEVFRMDRIYNLAFECRKNYNTNIHTPIESKIFFNSKLHLLLDHKIMIYKNGVAIRNEQLSQKQNYGEIHFKVLWEKFPDQFPFSERNDYTFIQNTFGNYYTVDTSGQQPIVCVHTCEECFVDWALMYINRIEILDEGDIEMVGRIKQKLRKILTEGIEILDH